MAVRVYKSGKSLPDYNFASRCNQKLHWVRPFLPVLPHDCHLLPVIAAIDSKAAQRSGLAGDKAYVNLNVMDLFLFQSKHIFKR